MSKQQKSKQTSATAAPVAAKQREEPTYPAVEDFFTRVLEKRKKNFTTKMDDISELEKKDPESLKPDQREKISKKAETLDKIRYYDDIKALYFEAHAKKGGAGGQSAVDEAVSDFANLFVVGQALMHFDRHAQNFETSFKSDQMTSLQDAFLSLTRVTSAAQLEEAKRKLRAYAGDEELRKAVGVFLGGHRFDAKESHHEHHTEAHAKPASRKQSEKVEAKKEEPAPKKRLFADEDEDDDHHHGHHHNAHGHGHADHHHHAANQAEGAEEGGSAPMDLLTPLPEGDDKKTDEFRSSHAKRAYNRDRPYKPRPPRDYQGAEGHGQGQAQGQGAEGHVQGQGQGQGDFQKQRRPYNNFNRGPYRGEQGEGQAGEGQFQQGERRPYRPRQEGDWQADRRPPRVEGENQGERRPPRGEGDWQNDRRPPRGPRQEGEYQGQRRPRQEGDWQGQGDRRPPRVQSDRRHQGGESGGFARGEQAPAQPQSTKNQ